MRLEGAVERDIVVITGAASGIGRGLAQIADERGLQIVLVDLDDAGLKETASQLGSEPMIIAADVCDEEAVDALAADVFRQWGRVDLFFNNAGILRGGLSWEISLTDWRRVLDVNVLGVVNCMNKFLPRMIATNRPCRIVNTASVGGFVSSPFIAPYTATKFAVVALTEALAIELKLQNTKVAVSLLAPGAVRSKIYSDPRTSTFGCDIRAAVDAMASFTDGTGLEPDVFARWVFEEIDLGRFWLIGQPEVFKPLIAQRAERILGGIGPEPDHYGSAQAGYEARTE